MNTKLPTKSKLSWLPHILEKGVVIERKIRWKNSDRRKEIRDAERDGGCSGGADLHEQEEEGVGFEREIKGYCR